MYKKTKKRISRFQRLLTGPSISSSGTNGGRLADLFSPRVRDGDLCLKIYTHTDTAIEKDSIIHY